MAKAVAVVVVQAPPDPLEQHQPVVMELRVLFRAHQ
jgi:hypothetical protein